MDDLERRLNDLVCRRHCHWFKESRKDPQRCGGFLRLHRLAEEDGGLLERIAGLPRTHHSGPPLLPHESPCPTCPFRQDGCDFAAGVPKAPPCGGYLVLTTLKL